MCVHASTRPHERIRINKSMYGGYVMTNLTSHSLFLYKELLHFCMFAEIPVLAFMANYVEK